MKMLLISALLLSTSSAYATDLSPNQNAGSGNIPGTYSSLTFSLADGNWASTLQLPATAAEAATITIQSSAGYTSTLLTTNTDYPLASLTISSGDKVSFTYQLSSKQWKITATTYTANTVGGGTIPALTGLKFARYATSDGNWASSIVLPATAANNTVVAISSNATYTSQISPQNVLFASTWTVLTGDTYAFSYRTDLQRWVPVKTPVRSFGAAQAGQVIARPTAPQTDVLFANGDWIPQITVPSTAGDRDKLVIRSTAEWTAAISNTNIDFAGTLKLFPGSRYELMFIQEKQRWVVQASVRTRINASQLVAGQLPDMVAPVTELAASDGNWTPAVILPKVGKPGDQVIMRSSATYGLDVSAQAGFTPVRINTGETVRFLYAGTGWTTETRIITMLLVYSDAAAARLGESAERARLYEAVRLTNEALENSRVNFYVKIVGIIKRQLAGGTLGAVVDVGRSDPVIQATRNQLAADAVYYEGTEEGCGLAWVNADAGNMLATGSLGCGTTVMRHEFGHNMGLNHADAGGGSAVYAKGYAPVASVMGGNAIGYYASPRLYTSDLGLAMGIDNQVDAARALNERSEVVSRFR
jgi:Metallo-peptidase family M12B Reprolysin-like